LFNNFNYRGQSGRGGERKGRRERQEVARTVGSVEVGRQGVGGDRPPRKAAAAIRAQVETVFRPGVNFIKLFLLVSMTLWANHVVFGMA
jgi:hypothetical protein